MTRRGKAAGVLVILLIYCVTGCELPASPTPALSAAKAQYTLDHWNPNYCKVIKFYGLHQPAAKNSRLAYVLLANPKEPTQKPILSVARFQLLNLPDGSQEWFLTSLLSHSGGLTRRQGWDNLLIPVKTKGDASSGGS